MMLSLRGIIAGMLAAGALGACAIVDNAVDPRTDTLNRSTARARNESILLNIVRASRNDPLNFVALNRVSGTTTSSATLSSPIFLIGPDPLPTTIFRTTQFNDRTANTSMTAGNTFDISLLETGGFYSALLAPVGLPDLATFTRQGYPRELLFWLFTDTVRITRGGQTREIRNDPFDIKECGDEPENCFPHLIDIASVSGLTVETRVVLGGKDKTSRTTQGRLCFDPILAAKAKLDHPEPIELLTSGLNRRPICGKDPWTEAGKGGASNAVQFASGSARRGAIEFEITTRSTFGIYRFLGRILAASMTEEIRLRDSRSYPGDDPRIMAVTRDGSPCFVNLVYEGENYCVPDRADNTKRIFGLLAQLLALKTTVQDLGITPVVRVSP
jgi:hypothetical protein